MLVSLEWLKEYVNLDNIAVEDIREGFIMSGSNIETVEAIGENIKKIVVGKILEIEKHPDAKSLIVTQIDIGEEVIQIVTGADNVKVGDYIPVILNGGRLPDGTKIKKGKLRGILSNGMMCSGQELGITDNLLPMNQNKEGIYILDKEYPLGTDIQEITGLKGHVIEFEITPNRPDCLSMIGMAREAQATFNREFKYPNVALKEEHGDIKEYISIDIEDTKLCDRYVGKVITDVKIKPSPLWMQSRLMKAGVRPINNIVDITNYVMIELGQPLHAFDLDYIEGNQIIVKKAKEGEMFKTLDETERKLDSNMLLICDAKKAVALAGVMGGENSEVKDTTKTIFLESAHFDGDHVRATSKKLALRTEASSRFEKGVDPNVTLIAANRACQLIEELGAGRIVKGNIDVYPNPVKEKGIEVRPTRINKVLGTSLSTEEMKTIFESLEFKVENHGENVIVTVPTFRHDMETEVDFVEEVARIYGFNNLDTTLPKSNSQGGKTIGQILEDQAKFILNAAGMNEIQTYSFVSPKSLDLLCFKEDSLMRNTIKLLNPLGEENSIMRTTIMGNVLEVLARNYNRNVERAKAFELGNTFIAQEDEKSLPLEKKAVTLGMYGKEVDFFEIKGIVEKLFEGLGIEDVAYIPEKNHPTFHPGRCANIIYKDHLLGVFGEVHPDVAENYGMNTRIYLGEIDFELILQLAKTDKFYKQLPKYPAMTRDFALVVKDDIYVKQIEDIVKENGGKILESIKLFDVYKGKQVEEGYKSVAYSLVYRSKDRTLTDEEVTKVHGKIIEELEGKLDGTLRE
ncbi:phenylalanine--tRNA ligase subunit beta [Lutibacter sp. B2]|nr:phenylalanine--tRNA ligase subunit beta [Lutibacter sp. B2]